MNDGFFLKYLFSEESRRIVAAGGWVEFNRVNGMALFTIYRNPYRKHLFSVGIMDHQLTNIFLPARSYCK